MEKLDSDEVRNGVENSASVSRLMRSNYYIKMLVGFMVSFVGLITSMLGISPSLRELIGVNLYTVVGTILCVSGFVYSQSVLLARRRESRFVDIDRMSANMPSDINCSELATRCDIMIANQESSGTNPAIAQAMPDRDRIKPPDILAKFESFQGYFGSIIAAIERKALNADEKASVLLDKGTDYSSWGIWFYIISIIVWQILALFQGFSAPLIYGVVSSSILFAFVEFLSAWFLRQYRHFVDTSTYLIKVKTLLDRYMLAFLAIQEIHKMDPAQSKESHQKLIGMLSEAIQWPSMPGKKSEDISFAKEAVESIASAIRSLNNRTRQ